MMRRGNGIVGVLRENILGLEQGPASFSLCAKESISPFVSYMARRSRFVHVIFGLKN